MKLLKLFLLVLAFSVKPSFSQETIAPANPPSNNKLSYALDATYRLDGQSWFNEHNVQYTHKFDDSFKISAQADFYTHYQYDPVKNHWSLYVKERYVRLKFVESPFINLLGFNTGWEVRYHLPVDETQEQQGTFGMVSPRLNMTRVFSDHFNLTLIPKMYIDMNRRGYQKYGTNQANELGGIGIEALPQWVFTPVLTLTYDPELIALAMGATPKQEHVTYQFYYDHELELMYTFKHFHNIGLGALWKMDYFFFGNGHISVNSNNEAFKGIRNRVGLRLIKTFDL